MWKLIAAALLAQIALPHSTHNPKHGGVFFLAANDTLHVEGVWPQQRVFKLYVYDEASRPLTPERMRALHGQVEAGGQTAPLILAGDGSAFVARIPPVPVAANIGVQIVLAPGAEPEGFLFRFPGYSDEHALSFDLEPTRIPATLRAIVGALRDDAREADRLVTRQQTAFVFAPAVRGRDHVLALERFLPGLPAGARPRAEAAIHEVVRTAWLMHTAGDDGSPDQVRESASLFRAAVDECADAFAGGAR